MTVLKGPADADHFRVQVGRYNDRWYADPLPACSIADATDAVWPSVSTVKKASGSDWSFVSVRRVAEGLHANPQRIAGLEFDALHDVLKSIDKNGLKAAGQRGTDVHTVAEAKLRGQVAALLPNAAGARWLPAVEAFFDAYQPKLVAAEVVAVNRGLNGVGYGGTFDAIVEIDGALYLIDWKSRGEDSRHGAYPEEAAQIAAYAAADYIIVDDGAGGAKRQLLPELAGGLIVSIKPDGYKVFPVDLGKAQGHWCSLHAWWVARRDERVAIGNPWAPRGAIGTVQGVPVVADASVPIGEPIYTDDYKKARGIVPRREMVTERVRALVDNGHGNTLALRWPEGVPGLKESDAHTGEQLAAILAVVRSLEDETSAPFHPADTIAAEPSPRTAAGTGADVTTAPVPPDEGDRVDAETIGLIAEALATLPSVKASAIGAIAKEANAAHRSISLQVLPSVRRFEIVRALLALAEHCTTDDGDLDEDTVRGLLALVLECTAAEWPTVPLGAVIGALTIDEAKRLAELASNMPALAVTVHDDGRCEFIPAAP